jgi:hypothetical protein
MSRRYVLSLVLLLVAAPLLPIHAQSGGDDACPSLVETALQMVAESCADLNRNEACYGYTRVLAEPRPGATITFAAPGDLAALADIARLQTRALNVETGEWGVVLMKVQADLPDTLPGQNVTLILFGEAELRPVPAADAATPPPMAAYPAPMQAFFLTTGLGESPCQEVPRDGLLIQAPQATAVHFLINGVAVEIGSTALLHTQEDGTLSVNTLAGTVAVTSAGETRTALPGLRVDAVAGAPPAEPMPYEMADVQNAPVGLLPEPVACPNPARLFDVGTCESGRREGVDDLQAGESVVIMQGCRWSNTWAEAEAVRAEDGGFISINGAAMSVYYPALRFIGAEPEHDIPAGWEVSVRTDWVAIPGSTTVQAYVPPFCGVHVCSFVVGGQ